MGQAKSQHRKTTPASPAKAQSPQALAPNDLAAIQNASPTGIPTVLRWGGGQADKVSVNGTWNNWGKAFPLSKSGDDFYAILPLEPGEHHFRFMVDGMAKVDLNQTTYKSTKGFVNTVTVSREKKLTAESSSEIFGKSELDIESEGWGTEEEKFEETRKFPPLCPPHLRFTPLNTPPQQRSFGQPSENAVASSSLSDDPCVLPLPLHVTLNHTYFQPRGSYNILGCTRRYKEKYCSIVFYKPDLHTTGEAGGSPKSGPTGTEPPAASSSAIPIR